MRRLLTALLASSLVLAACGGGDDGPSAADDRKAADAAVDAFAAAARDEGFEVDPEADDDDGDDDLEFRSEECRELEEVLGDDDDDVAGQTADVESDDFVRSDGDFEETLSASLVIADADALQEELDVMDDEQVESCIEEAMEISFEEAGAEQDLQMTLTDFAVTLEHPELGDSAVLVHASGTIDAVVLQLPFTFELLAVREGRRGATVTYASFGTEPTVSAETFVEPLLSGSASA